MPIHASRLNSLIYAGFVGLTVCAGFISNGEGGFLPIILRGGVFLLCILWLLEEIVTKKGELHWIQTPANGMLIVLILLLSLQWLPLPEFFTQWFSPVTFENRNAANALLRQTGFLDSPAVPMTVGYNARAAMAGWVDFLAAAGIFWVGLHCLKSRGRLIGFAAVLLGGGALKAIIELVQSPAEHHGGIPELTLFFLMTAVVWLAQEKVRSQRMESGLDSRRAVFQRWIHRLSPETTRPRMIFIGIVWGLIGGVILYRETPPGLVGNGISLLLVSGLLCFKKRFRWPALIGLGAGGVFLLQGLVSGQAMACMIHAALEAGMDYPVIGSGMGSGLNILRLHTPGATHVCMWGRGVAAIGIPATGLCILWGVTVFFETFKIWRNRRDRLAIGAWAGAVSALLMLAVRAGLESHFSVRALLMAAGITALGYAALHRQGRGYSESFFYRTKRIVVSYQGRVLLLGLLLVGAGILGWQGIIVEEKGAGGGYNPAGIANPKQMVSKGSFSVEMQSLVTGLAEDPTDAEAWYRLGKMISLRKNDPLAYLKTHLPLADRLMEMALYWGPFDAVILSGVADYWVERSMMLPAAVPEMDSTGPGNGLPGGSDSVSPSFHGGDGNIPRARTEGILKFQTLYQRCLKIAPERWEQAVEQVWLYYPEDDPVLEIIPENRGDLIRKVLRKLAVEKGPEIKN